MPFHGQKCSGIKKLNYKELEQTQGYEILTLLHCDIVKTPIRNFILHCFWI